MGGVVVDVGVVGVGGVVVTVDAIVVVGSSRCGRGCRRGAFGVADGGRLVGDERAVDDDPLAGRPLRVARRQRQLGDVGVGGGDHVDVVGLDDLGARHRVDEATGEGGRDDLVARLEIVDVVERPAVRHAVAGDRGVAVLARQRRARVVAGPAA